MAELFFTSDMHFGHVNAATKFRGFDTVEEHDEFLVERWNATVGPRDRVIILGDACMGTITDTIRIIARLHGEKWLQPGNHDWLHPAHHGRVTALAKGKTQKVLDMEALYFEAFDEILKLHIVMSLGDLGMVTVCHFPPYGDHTDEERYAEYRPEDRGQRFLHGHVHDLWADKEDGRLINVGVDVRNYAPVSTDELETLYP